MNVQDALNHVLTQIPTLTQKRLADEASLAGLKVNRGQLSAWLRREGPLSEEREGNIVRALLKLVSDASEEEGRDYRTELADVVRVLESHLSQRKPPRNLHGEPISARDPAYIERVEDKRLLSWLGVDPLWASILGGPKMGKSSLLLRALQELKRRSSNRSPILLVQVDFAEYRAEKTRGSSIAVLPWFARQCELQVGTPFRDLLSLPENFHGWLERNIIAASEGGRCAFLLDHLEELWDPEAAKDWRSQDDPTQRPHGDLETLFTALHDYLNETYDDSRFDRCKFLFAFDNAHEAFDEVGRGLSSMRFEMNVIRMTNFSGGSVARLLEQRGLSTTEANAKASVAIEQCGGHPFLTQAWIRVHVGGEDAQVLDDAWSTLLECLRARWSQRYWELLLAAGASDSWQCGSTTSSTILVQSGLIERTRVRTLTDEVRPSGSWIQAKFKEALANENEGNSSQ